MKLIHLSCILGFTVFAQAQAPKFELRDGDRVLLLGDALLERENTLGYLEARMHAAWPSTKFTVRNLSWAGDTPKGWSRASFDGPAKGYERLKEQIALVKPTVVFLGYGMAASLQEMTDRSNDIMLNRDPARYGEEPMSAARFKKELGELMTDIEAIGEKPRFVLLSPIKHEDLRKARPGMTDPTKHNELLAQYSKSIEELAKERGARFVNLAGKIINTQNGIHLTNDGFSSFAQQLAEQLGGAPESKLLRPREDYLLAAVLRKNDLFFHRTRPANSTYLFGFRKHEQGRNAVEIPQFDPLVEKEDAEIIEVKTTPKGAVPSFLRGTGMESDWLAREAGVKIPAVVVPSAEDTAAKDDGQSAVLSLALIGDKPVVALNGSTLQSIDEIPEALKKLKPTRVVVRADSNVKYSVAKEVLRHVEAGGDMKVTFSVTDNKKVAERLPIPNFTTEEGYEITLWADTNLVGKPVGMNWDAAGRLWVACSPVYPQIKPGAHPEDKVVVIEDTDKDGKADKSTTFATDLLIAAGVAPEIRDAQPATSQKDANSRAVAEKPPGANDASKAESASPHPASRIPHLASAYVGASTELVHVTDTDGDGKADQRRVVLSGFGTEDTHHTIHTLKWGPDGRLFFNQSIYIHSHLETPYGMVRVNSGAVMAYDPRTERTEVIAKGWCNPWGHVWDEWGQQFTTDGAGGQGISWLVPGAMYFTYENARRIMPSVSPGSYPKFCGLEYVRSPLFPAEWQGNFITCDFRAHRIARFSMKDLSPAKSGYETKAEADLVRTTDSSFRPIDVKLGPDGALYVADWTNPVINHGEVDFRDPRRDQVNGRIWRIAPKGKEPLKWESLVGKKVEELGEAQNSLNSWKAHAASALLKEVAEQFEDKRNREKHGTEPITKKLNAIVIPKIDFKEATVREAFEFLIKQSKLHDAEKEGVSMSLMMWGATGLGAAPATVPGGVASPAPASGESRITLSLSNVPLIEALKYVTVISNLEYRIGPSGVTIFSSGAKPEPIYTQQWKVNLNLIPRENPSDKDTPKQILVSADVPFPPGTSVFLQKSTNTLTVENTEENLVLIDRIFEGLDIFLARKDYDEKMHLSAIRDTTPRVRLEAMRALSRIPTAESAALVLEAAVNAPAADEHYAYAAWLSVNDLAPQVMEYVEKLAADTASAAKNQAAISFALQSLPSAKTGPLLSKIVAKNGVPVEGPWIELIGTSGGPAECEKLLDCIRAMHPGGRRGAAALVAAARRGVKPPGASLEIIKLAPDEVKADALRLAGLWKLDAVEFITATMNGASQPVIDASFDALATLRTPAAATTLETLLAKGDAGQRRRALEALAAFKPDAALAGLSAVAADGDEAAKLALFRSLFQSETFKGKFVKAVPADLPKPAAEAALRAARELGRKGEALVAALTPIAGAPAPASNAGDIAAMVTNVQKNGNPVEGETIYRRLALACTACHAIGGAGGKVGPDMTTIGASAPLDYLIESLYVPNAKVKEGYNAVAFSLKGGRAANGVLLRETPDAVFLRDAAGNETSVPKADITARENVGSIMPAGLLNTLTDREKAHVFAFLAQLGKPGPFDATKASVARVWWLYPGKDVEAVVSGKIATPGAKTLTYVDGRLPKAALAEALQMVPDSGDTVVAVAKFAGAGKTRLNMQGVTKAWLDGAPLAIASNPSPEVELTAGNHTLVVKLDTKQLPEVLRADCPEGRFATE